MHAPVFLAFESADFVFALANQPQRRTLHPPRTQAAADLFPQQGRQIEADQIVQRTARLLGIDQVHIQLARLLQGSLNAFLGHFVKHHPLRARFQILNAALGFQDFVNMPGNRLAFPIRVGSQIQVFRFFGSSHDGIDVLFAFGRHFVFHREIVLGIDRAVFRHQIAHMAERGEHFEIAAQIFFDGFDFVWGFDNQ